MYIDWRHENLNSQYMKNVNKRMADQAFFHFFVQAKWLVGPNFYKPNEKFTSQNLKCNYSLDNYKNHIIIRLIIIINYALFFKFYSTDNRDHNHTWYALPHHAFLKTNPAQPQFFPGRFFPFLYHTRIFVSDFKQNDHVYQITV